MDADALGHDLTFGTSSFTRSTVAAAPEADTPASAEAAEPIPASPDAPDPLVDELAEARSKRPSELPVPF